MKIRISHEKYAVVKLHSIPNIRDTGSFISLSVSEKEISLVCPDNQIPTKYILLERNWRLLKVNQILDFEMTGVIFKISSLLANEQISIFVISTYDTDYFLVKEKNLQKTIKILSFNNYMFSE
ncbi:MAG: ACT domain-containing protein [Clostridiales bacterium]|nr:ACT domain-containing protein [Clostridiales bacterium]